MTIPMSVGIVWLTAAMLRWANPADWGTEVGRYVGIATDAVAVANDPEEPPLYTGPGARVQTAALLLNIAYYESNGFDPNVDAGLRRGDSGRSWCLGQIHLGTARVLMVGLGYGYAPSNSTEGWSGQDLVADRKKCFRASLHIARMSLLKCGDLTQYVSGYCGIAPNEARKRATLATLVMRRKDAPSDESLTDWVWNR